MEMRAEYNRWMAEATQYLRMRAHLARTAEEKSLWREAGRSLYSTDQLSRAAEREGRQK